MAKLYSKRTGANGYDDPDDESMRECAEDDYGAESENDDANRFQVPFFLELKECPEE